MHPDDADPPLIRWAVRRPHWCRTTARGSSTMRPVAAPRPAGDPRTRFGDKMTLMFRWRQSAGASNALNRDLQWGRSSSFQGPADALIRRDGPAACRAPPGRFGIFRRGDRPQHGPRWAPPKIADLGPHFLMWKDEGGFAPQQALGRFPSPLAGVRQGEVPSSYRGRLPRSILRGPVIGQQTAGPMTPSVGV